MKGISCLREINAKTGTERDYVDDQSDDHSPINSVETYAFDEPIERNNTDKHPVATLGEILLNLCKNSHLRILNGRTKGDRLGNLTRFPLSLRESPGTLDYMLCDTEIIKKVKVFSVLHHLGLSDHECLSVTISTQGLIVTPTPDTPIINEGRFKYADTDEFILKLKSPFGKEKINEFLKVYSESPEFPIEAMTTDLIDIINSASAAGRGWKGKKKKKKERKKSDPPWFSSDSKRLKSSLNRAEKEYKRDPFNLGRKEKLFSARKKYKRCCRQNERAFRDKLTSQLLATENAKPAEFWKLVKEMKSWGNCTNDSCETIHPNEWLDHFQKLFNETKPTQPCLLQELERLEKYPYFSDLDFRISVKDIERALKRLNKKASPGPDRISGSLLFAGKDSLMPLIKLFFDKLFSHCTQPEIYSLNFLITILKKGENWDPDNYRGIAVGSALAKIFSLIILDRVEYIVNKARPISPHQIGFKKGHRTSDHIFVLHSIVNKIVKTDKGKLFIAFIDFCKA